MEADKKVLVNKTFLNTTHGKISCAECHSGSAGNTRSAAHQNMNAAPSSGENSKCSACHSKITVNFKNTLHASTASISDSTNAIVLIRADKAKLADISKGLKNNCSTCHVETCGTCHISRPKAAGGGFVNGHNFYKTPKSVLNCTACHGSRIEKEYMATAAEEYPELKPDVHWIPQTMQCADCHKSDWIHNDNPLAATRYEVKAAPKCENCHTAKVGFKNISAHQKHAIAQTGSTLLQCQVCHAQPYNNCYSCHVGMDKQNLPFYKTQKSEFMFKIGRNPSKTGDRPYDYVVVRHVPVDKNTFEFYGDNLLSNFNAAPTWKYATPHNIQRITPQGQCNGCHGNTSIFLTEKDVLPEELTANQSVIVTKLPPK
ncbi:MAG: multiheme c-type cytochrome [Eubacteriales bacterium]